MDTLDLSVVIPIRNEADHLDRSVTEIIEQVQSLNLKYEILLIDDGSDDATWDLIRKLSVQFVAIKGIQLSRNFGKEFALCAGLERAQGENILVMDGDLQHPPHLIRQMLALKKETGVAVVEGVKAQEDLGLLRGTLRGFYYKLQKVLSGYELARSSDFKLFDRRVLEAWKKCGEVTLYFRGMMAWLGFSRQTIEFQVPTRAGSKSKWTILSLADHALSSLISFSSFPLRIVFLAGLLFFLAASGFGIYTLVYYSLGRAVTGFTTVIILLLMIGSLVMMALGIIGEYIARIYSEIKHRPRYIIAETVGRMPQ